MYQFKIYIVSYYTLWMNEGRLISTITVLMLCDLFFCVMSSEGDDGHA
jgi:hypothetical protein